MTKPLTETVTVTRPVDPRIADLVHFVRYVDECLKRSSLSTQGHRDIATCTDAELVMMANDYWERQHGED